MNVIIIGTVPTVYQQSSIRSFKLPVKKNMDGSFTTSEKFKTIKEDRQHLIDVANIYFENSKELKEALYEIKHLNRLSIDAAIVNIKY